MKDRNRVVVTGLGVMTPLGEHVDEYWRGLLQGKSGIGPMTLCDPEGYPCQIAGEVWGFDPNQYMNPKEARRMARFSQLAVAAALRAAEDSGLDFSVMDPYAMGVVLGNGNGGMPTTEEQCRVLISKGGMRISPFYIAMTLPNMAAANISRFLGLKGYTSTIVTACASGTQALGEAAEVIRRGAAKVVFAGGTEAGISNLALGGFCVMKALTSDNQDPTQASKPFDARRDGFVPAEGSGVLVLEEMNHAINRGVRIYAEIIGYGVSSDAYHPVQPDQNGDGALRAMRDALIDAETSVEAVDYINAHGTSTPINDVTETKAIKGLFGDFAYKIPISSTKSMIGHAMGGSGAVEAVATIKSIENSWVHPTINYCVVDKDCDLDYVPNVARSHEVNIALTNSFGFGGQNASLVIKKFAN